MVRYKGQEQYFVVDESSITEAINIMLATKEFICGCLEAQSTKSYTFLVLSIARRKLGTVITLLSQTSQRVVV
jgi:hypothetical protein